jgi:GxxExxY protein
VELVIPPCTAVLPRFARHEQPISSRCNLLTDPAGINDLTHEIIGCAIKVHKALGPGLLESAYERCLALELSEAGHSVEVRKAVPLVYRNATLDACYFLDMMVDERVIAELKSVDVLAPIREAQMLTYLRMTRCPVGLLINFNVQLLKDGIQRVVNAMS